MEEDIVEVLTLPEFIEVYQECDMIVMGFPSLQFSYTY